MLLLKFLFSEIPIHKLDKVSLGCVLPFWTIIAVVVGTTSAIIIAVVVTRKWTSIKFHFYARFTNDDDSQDLSKMKYDVFISYRLLSFDQRYLFILYKSRKAILENQ